MALVALVATLQGTTRAPSSSCAESRQSRGQQRPIHAVQTVQQASRRSRASRRLSVVRASEGGGSGGGGGGRTRSGASLHAGWWSRHCSAIATSASKNRKRPFGQQGLATSPAGSRELSYLAIWFDTCARRRQCTFSTMWRRWRQRFGGGRRTACHVTDGATHRRATAIEDEECLIGALK